LTTQSDSPFFAAVIRYLTEGVLPTDRNLANRVTFQSDDYFIENQKLYHLARIRGKRLSQILPRWPQLVIPKAYRELVLRSFHGLSHTGFLKSYLTCRMRYYWDGQATDFKLYISACETCMQIKHPQPANPKLPLTSLKTRKLFEVLHLDHHTIDKIAGSQKVHPYKHVLILRDSISLMTVLEPCVSTGAEEAAKLVFDRYIMQFGCPKYVVSDRAQTWLSELFRSLIKLAGLHCKHLLTSPRHPSTNSIAELANKDILRHIRAFCDN
jgi:hypothetical protein